MGTLKQKLQDDLTSGMKLKNTIMVDALRMVKAAILKWEVSGDRRFADDPEIVEIIKKEIKQRQDSSSEYRKGNRPELAEKEEAEIEIIKKYLPPQMSEEEITAIVQKAIQDVNATSPADIGKVMGSAIKDLKGKADGTIIREIVEKLLKSLKE